MYRIRVSLIIITCIVTIILAVLVDRKGNVYMGCLTSNHAIPRSYIYFLFFEFGRKRSRVCEHGWLVMTVWFTKINNNYVYFNYSCCSRKKVCRQFCKNDLKLINLYL